MKVLYEDNHIIVVEKPFCVPSQGDATGDESVLDWVKKYIKEKYEKPGEVFAGIVHRLDRPVGGVMVLARTSKGASRLSDSFRNRKVEKTYWAITESIPARRSGRLEHYLKKLGNKNIMRAYDQEVPDSKLSILDYEVLRTKGNRALIEIRPTTGRRHQIRVQLASMGCVIKGDVKYGETEFNPDKSICLISKVLEFPHPIKDKGILRFEADYPTTASWSEFKP